MTELKPCPFCGGEVETCHVTQLWEPRNSYWVKCKNCRINGVNHTTESEAIAAWNTRAERTCHDVSVDSSTQFYCSVCECTVDIPLLWGDLKYCPGCGAHVERGAA